MLKHIIASMLFFGTATAAFCDEGQWQPHQLLELKNELKAVGIETAVKKLANLDQQPLAAIVSLGSCSASFVSPKGLVLTNHHCAYGDIQHNATAQNNMISLGFLARSPSEELPANPNTRVYVTDRVENVSDRVLKGLDPKLAGFDYYEAIQKRIKTLIAECDEDKAYRCSVPSFHRGLEYYRIRQLMIRDVRLVYAPSDKIGNFGGEVDNFEWPRHTGDFAFLRAYVGPDGRPADPSPKNVPYQSPHYLKVAAEGVQEGDPILLAGYPGRTNRYKLPIEIRDAMKVSLPRAVAEAKSDLAVIDLATQNNPEWKVRYASVVKSIKNVLKKNQGLLEGFGRKDLAAIKDQQFEELRSWLSRQPNAAEYQALLTELDRLVAEDLKLKEQQFAWGLATQSEILRSALTLYRLALEKEKPDDARETGYQERDFPFIKSKQARLEQTLVSEVDKLRWQGALSRYHDLSKDQHPTDLDTLLSAPAELPKLYESTNFHKLESRLASMQLSAEAMRQSKDPIVQMAIKLHPINMALEVKRKTIEGNLERVIPRYMQAVIAWKRSLKKPVYPDANSTLRVTYGSVAAYAPQDGLTKGPFTTVEGILAKAKKEAPFQVEEALEKAIREKRYGIFLDKKLKTVPVNFLSNADTTGGNSGSAVVNSRGELVGLNFDSTYESITKDWYFDVELTRTIHVDIRYLLWVMKEVNGAHRLLEEMSILYPKRS